MRVCYGPGWEECIPYLQILSISYATWHLQIINLNLLKAGGPTWLFLRLELIKKCLGIGILIGMFFISVQAICWGALGTSTLCLAINTWATRHYMHQPIRQQLHDWLPGFALAAACTWLPAQLLYFLTPLPLLGAGLLLSLGIYLGIWKTTSPTVLRDGWHLLKQLRHNQ